MNESKETRSFLVPRPPSIDRRFRPKPKKVLNLFNLIKEDEESLSDHEDASQSSRNSDESESDNVENALVFLRMRPVKNPVSLRYSVAETTLVTRHFENNTTNIQNAVERHFSFNYIYDENVVQGELYDNCIRGQIEAEKNFTVMTYGTSGSGKTYTLLGTPEQPGIIPRSLENIFDMYSQNLCNFPSVLIKNGAISIASNDDLIENKNMRKALLDGNPDLKRNYDKSKAIIDTENSFGTRHKDNETVLIYCSFIEIYNEVVHDLLNIKTNKTTNINNNTLKKTGHKVIVNDGKVFIKDVTSVLVKNSFEAYQLLCNGLKKVTYASTAINENSSRSHCIFMLDIIKYHEPDIFSHTCYKFCDLAGSERLQKTDNKGTRLKEAQQINKSLMVLGRCLDTTYNNQNKKNVEIVPYRESKLTMLLQAPLQGREKITMIVNITPTEEYYEENLNVLSFASLARNIVYKPVEEKRRPTRFSFLTNTISREEFDILFDENCTLRSEIERLSNIIESLEKQNVQQEVDLRKELVSHFEAEAERTKNRWEEKLHNTETSLKKFYEGKIETIKSSYERKIERLNEELESYEDEIETIKGNYEKKIEKLSANDCTCQSAKRLRTNSDSKENYNVNDDYKNNSTL